MNLKRCGKLLEQALRDTDLFMDRDCSSDFSSDVCFFSFDGMGGFIETVLGGDYESSITFCVSRWGEVSVELYFSNAKARSAARYLPSILANLQGMYETMSTPYIPGQSALSCRVSLNGVNDANAYDYSTQIIQAACYVIIQMSKALGVYIDY